MAKKTKKIDRKFGCTRLAEGVKPSEKGEEKGAERYRKKVENGGSKRSEKSENSPTESRRKRREKTLCKEAKKEAKIVAGNRRIGRGKPAVQRARRRAAWALRQGEKEAKKVK